jgi:hypothetical protein
LLRESQVKSNRHVKMLHGVLRFPHLSDQFRKLCKKRNTEDQEKQAHEKSILTLRQYKFDEEPVEQLTSLLNELLQKDKSKS